MVLWMSVYESTKDYDGEPLTLKIFEDASLEIIFPDGEVAVGEVGTNVEYGQIMIAEKYRTSTSQYYKYIDFLSDWLFNVVEDMSMDKYGEPLGVSEDDSENIIAGLVYKEGYTSGSPFDKPLAEQMADVFYKYMEEGKRRYVALFERRMNREPTREEMKDFESDFKYDVQSKTGYDYTRWEYGW